MPEELFVINEANPKLKPREAPAWFSFFISTVTCALFKLGVLSFIIYLILVLSHQARSDYLWWQCHWGRFLKEGPLTRNICYGGSYFTWHNLTFYLALLKDSKLYPTAYAILTYIILCGVVSGQCYTVQMVLTGLCGILSVVTLKLVCKFLKSFNIEFQS